jgi:hypothetical protein
VQKTIFVMMCATLGVAACSSGDNNGPVKRVSVDGKTMGIATDGAQHVAYVLNATPAFGTTGELHLSAADGKDVKLATGVSVGGYLLSPRGKGMLFTQAIMGADDASLSWVDLSNPSAPPKVVLPNGLQTQPITAGTTAPTFTTPLLQQGFLSPSGRFYIFGVLAPKVGGSPDLHVIDMDTGSEVFVRENGAFDYLELALPNDVMVYQDAVGGNSGIAGGAGLQTLFWVDLASGTPTATQIATRTGAYTPTGDNKAIVYQDADARELYVWDAVARPATGTKVASNALGFAVGQSGPIVYIGTDHSLHVIGLDGKAIVDVDAATAKADFFSPLFMSDDGADVYYYQSVVSQNGQGTLMHLAGTTAGATPAKIADSASLFDTRVLPGGVLLYLANVDGLGVSGDAFRSMRDGSGATALGAKVPIGFLAVQTPAMGMPDAGSAWVSAHLFGATENKDQKLADEIRAIVGGLELTTAAGNAMVEATVRLEQFQVSDDLQSLVWVSGAAFDSVVDNYVGSLEWAPVAMPSMKPMAPLLAGVTEVGSVVGKKTFVNAPKAATPGVYFVSF